MDIVFTGIVVQKQDAPEEFSRSVLSGADYREGVIATVQVKFDVSFKWKGDMEDEITLYTLNPQESEWGYDFKDKDRYLVFARIDKSNDKEDLEGDVQQIWTNLCYQNVDLIGYFGDNNETEGKERSLLSESDEIDESRGNLLERESHPFLLGVSTETELNKQLAVFKLRAHTEDEKAARPDNEVVESTSSN